jgi:hypothetical protein
MLASSVVQLSRVYRSMIQVISNQCVCAFVMELKERYTLSLAWEVEGQIVATKLCITGYEQKCIFLCSLSLSDWA